MVSKKVKSQLISDHSKRILSWIVFCLLGVALPVSAASVSPSLMAVLSHGDEGSRFPVIVTFAAQEQPVQMARRMGSGGRSDFVREMKGRSQNRVRQVQQGLPHTSHQKLRKLWLIDGIALDATAAEIEQLAQMAEVVSVSLDETFFMPEILPAQADSVLWNIARTGAPELWSRGFRGEGVTIAFLDSGVNLAHPDLAGRWRGLSGDWFDPYGNSSSPYDFGSYHGTAVASIAVGGSAGDSAIGMAPDADYIVGKVFRDDGSAVSSSIIEVLQWVLNPGGDPELVPDIVNVSWGFEDNPDECLETLGGQLLRKAFQMVRDAGIPIIAAAGNSGPDPFTSTSPANFPEVMAIGATEFSDEISLFSGRGPSACSGAALYPDLVAPGTHIWAAGQGSSYRSISGTSFATAHVSGAMALIMQASGPLPVDEVERLLIRSAMDLGATGADDTYGYGLVNLPAAIELAESLQAFVVTPEQLDFSVVTVTDVSQKVIAVINRGNDILSLDIDSAGITAPFSLVENQCPANLEPDQMCHIAVSFAPATAAEYEGRILIGATDSIHQDAEVILTGTGNTPPPKPALIFPDDGAGLDSTQSAQLQWGAVTDADGDEVTYTLLVADNDRFIDSRAYSVVATGAVLSGFGLLFGVRRFRKQIFWLMLITFLVCLASCGGGGGGSGGSNSASDDSSLKVTLDDLEQGTTYYWKVRAEDARGAVTESDVRSFFVE